MKDNTAMVIVFVSWLIFVAYAATHFDNDIKACPACPHKDSVICRQNTKIKNDSTHKDCVYKTK